MLHRALMKPTHTILDEILVDVRREVAAAQTRRPLAELQRMAADAPPIRCFAGALRRGFGLIAEIKERSPSQGPMRAENVAAAPAAYEASPLVRCLSVLTNASHFGMSIERLREAKLAGTKPVLRKDFIFDDYQVHEARAFGADAILLMANLLGAEELKRLFALARSLEMDVLFECHDEEQIRSLPAGAVICGINSRSFSVRGEAYAAARAQRAAGSKDITTDLSRFDSLAGHLPVGAIKVAESGVYPENAARIRDELGYHAILVGTSLLTSTAGVRAELTKFASALAGS
jgi:indole-3-glycerol phosphate synthase